MLLDDIILGLDADEYGRQASSDFAFRSRYVGNFIRRKIKPLKFRTAGFRAIAVNGCRASVEACEIRPVNVLVADVAFEKEKYESMAPGELHEFFIGMLLEGVVKCSAQHQVPRTEIERAVDAFREEDYRNEWTHKKKAFRSIGVQAYLNCSLDTDKFLLRLKLERMDGAVVFDDVVLKTKPDETIFAYKFKDVVLDDDQIVIRDKFGEPTCSLELGLLGL